MVLRAVDLAAERPDEIAFRDDAVALGWAAVNDVLNRAVNAIGELDLGPDRRLAVLADNSVETVLAHLGTLLAGASSVPVNFHLNIDEVAYILEDSGAQALFVGPSTAAVGVEAAKRTGVPMLIGWRCDGLDGLRSWETWLAASSDEEPSPDVEPRPNLMYTSGTTGRPKGVDLPPTMFAGGGTMTEHVAALGTSAFAAFGTHLVVGPMYHTGPLSGVRLLAAGVPVVVLGRFDAETVLRAIDTHRVETTVMVPTHFVRLLALPQDVAATGTTSARCGWSPTPARVPHRCQAADDRVVRAGAAGRLRRHRGRHDVHDLQRRMARPPGLGGPGGAPFRALVVTTTATRWRPASRVVCSSRMRPAGGSSIPASPRTAEPTCAPASSRSARSGTSPTMDTLHHRPLLGHDDFGGVNIYPAEAEQILMEHSQVADVAVIGVPNREMGEEVKALVCRRSGRSA